MKKHLWRVLMPILALTLTAVSLAQAPAMAAAPTPPVSGQAQVPVLWMPNIQRGCAATGQTYNPGLVYKAESDVPLRPAWNHADKNLALRSYAIDNSLSNPQKQIQNLYGPTLDPKAPNLHTLFNPSRVPTVLNVYDVYNWIWATSPDPGTRDSSPVNTPWPITVAGVQVTPGETIRMPSSGYDLGAGVAAIVLYADWNRITLHYTREDIIGTSIYPGYSIHIENICVDPNLLALYNSLEAAGRYSQPSFNLVTLTALQPIGTALGSEMRLVVRDTGAFMDPRSLTDWWQ